MQPYTISHYTPQEDRVLFWLSKSGPLEIAQVIRLLGGEAAGKKSLKRLLQHKTLEVSQDEKYVGLYRDKKLDEEAILAVWVFLASVGDIPDLPMLESGVFMSAPRRLTFLKDNHIYQIVIVDPVKLYQVRGMDTIPNARYVFVVPDLDVVDDLQMIDVPCAFCTVSDRAPGQEAPEVEFYQ